MPYLVNEYSLQVPQQLSSPWTAILRRTPRAARRVLCRSGVAAWHRSRSRGLASQGARRLPSRPLRLRIRSTIVIFGTSTINGSFPLWGPDTTRIERARATSGTSSVLLVRLGSRLALSAPTSNPSSPTLENNVLQGKGEV